MKRSATIVKGKDMVTHKESWYYWYFWDFSKCDTKEDIDPDTKYLVISKITECEDGGLAGPGDYTSYEVYHYEPVPAYIDSALELIASAQRDICNYKNDKLKEHGTDK